MRFAAVNVPAKQPEAVRTPAADFIRRLVAGPGADRQAAPVKAPETPLDLDQRVRLVGEW